MNLTLSEAKELVEWTVFMLVVGFALACWVWHMHKPEAHAADKARLDWLEEQVQGGVITSAFEIDGGVFLDIAEMGGEEVSYREQRDLRSAIDAAMQETQR